MASDQPGDNGRPCRRAAKQGSCDRQPLTVLKLKDFLPLHRLSRFADMNFPAFAEEPGLD
jgi:hypothetical protein